MSFEEKSTWIMTVIGPTAGAIYLVILFGRLQEAPAAEVAYQWPMLTTIGLAIVASIVAHIVIAIAAPKEADKKDERDININRHGEYIGGFVLAVCTLGVLALTMAEYAHFWIANALYLAFVLANVTSSVVKIVAYRRGF